MTDEPTTSSEKATRFNVVLFQPEIPQNTGNIGRTCVALGAKLWIVRPAGFRLDDKLLTRAGLDYWQYLDWEAVDCWEAMESKLSISRTWFFTKHATRPYSEVRYETGDWFVFGSESSGLPQSLRDRFQAQCVGLPMVGPVRSINLAVAVGVGLFEAQRQVHTRLGH